MAEINYADSTVQSGNKPLYEALRDFYDDTAFVTVMNIDTEPLKYQFSNPQDELFVSNAPYHGEIHRKNPPTVVTLAPGERRLCPAFEADAMIVTLIKKLTTKRTAIEIAEGKVRPDQATNWSDPATQAALLKEIIVSTEDLVNKYNQSLNQPDEVSDVEKDLELEPAPQPRTRRPRQAE